MEKSDLLLVPTALLRRVKKDLEEWIQAWKSWNDSEYFDLPGPSETLVLIEEIEEILNRE